MDLSLAQTRSVEGRIASNAGLLFGAKALGVGLGVVALIKAAAALGVVEFGIVVFLHGYMLFFAEMMTFQPWQSIIRYGSDDVEADDGMRLARLVKFAAKLDAVAVVLAYGASVALFFVFLSAVRAFPWLWQFSDQVDPARLFTLVCAYCSVVLFQQVGMSTGVLRLFDRFAGLAAASLVMPTLRLIGVLVAVDQGWGLIGFVAVWYVASVVRYLTVIALGMWELHRRGLLAPAIRARSPFRDQREGLWAFSTKAFVDSSLVSGFVHLPMLLVMPVFGPAIAGVYKVAEEVAKLLSEGVKLLDQVIYPELTRIIAAGEGRQILRLVLRASALALGIGLVLALLVWLFGPGVVDRFLDDGFGLAVNLAVLLVIGAAIFAAVAPLYPVFYAVGRPERAIYARATGIVAYVVAFFVFGSWLGPIGIGWASIVGYGVGLLVVSVLISGTLSRLHQGAP